MPNEKDSRTTPADASKANGNDLRVIGVPRRRVDARAKVMGQTRFADDIFLPAWGIVNCCGLRILMRASVNRHFARRRSSRSVSRAHGQRRPHSSTEILPSARMSKLFVSTACGTSGIPSLHHRARRVDSL